MGWTKITDANGKCTYQWISQTPINPLPAPPSGLDCHCPGTPPYPPESGTPSATSGTPNCCFAYEFTYTDCNGDSHTITLDGNGDGTYSGGGGYLSQNLDGTWFLSVNGLLFLTNVVSNCPPLNLSFWYSNSCQSSTTHHTTSSAHANACKQLYQVFPPTTLKCCFGGFVGITATITPFEMVLSPFPNCVFKANADCLYTEDTWDTEGCTGHIVGTESYPGLFYVTLSYVGGHWQLVYDLLGCSQTFIGPATTYPYGLYGTEGAGGSVTLYPG